MLRLHFVVGSFAQSIVQALIMTHWVFSQPSVATLADVAALDLPKQPSEQQYAAEISELMAGREKQDSSDATAPASVGRSRGPSATLDLSIRRVSIDSSARAATRGPPSHWAAGRPRSSPPHRSTAARAPSAPSAGSAWLGGLARHLIAVATACSASTQLLQHTGHVWTLRPCLAIFSRAVYNECMAVHQA